MFGEMLNSLYFTETECQLMSPLPSLEYPVHLQRAVISMFESRRQESHLLGRYLGKRYLPFVRMCLL